MVNCKSTNNLDPSGYEEIKKTFRDTSAKLTFQPVDFSLNSIVNMMNNDKIILNPDYQRRHRWKKKQNSLLIESFLLGIPVPPIFLIQDLEELGILSVIDGQQRLRAIQDYFNNKYGLGTLNTLEKLKNKRYNQLKRIGLSDILDSIPLRTFILKCSDPNLVYDIFSRLNTGGVNLSFQEVRNATYARSELNKLIKELGDNKTFLELIGVKSEKENRYKTMENCELVLRYFAIRKEGFKKFRHSKDKFLNNYMNEHLEIREDKIDELEQFFKNTMDSIKIGLENFAFRKIDDGKPRPAFSPSAYDCIIHAFDNMDQNLARSKREEIKNAYELVWKNEEFLSLTQKGTNTLPNLSRRIQIMDDAISKAIER